MKIPELPHFKLVIFRINVFICSSLGKYQVNVSICTPLWMTVEMEMFYVYEKIAHIPVILDISTIMHMDLLNTGNLCIILQSMSDMSKCTAYMFFIVILVFNFVCCRIL